MVKTWMSVDKVLVFLLLLGPISTFIPTSRYHLTELGSSHISRNSHISSTVTKSYDHNSMINVNFRNTTRKGFPHTIESRSKISAANKGKIPWNAGRKHSEETRLKIARTTKDAMMKIKKEKAITQGISLAEYELKVIEMKKLRKRQNLKGGLTEEGRRKISESMKRRWMNPEFRSKYSASSNRTQSEAVRAKISATVKQKWAKGEYNSRYNIGPSDEVREKISRTLKEKWTDPIFREKMSESLRNRDDKWKKNISTKIKEKWLDDNYRSAVIRGISKNVLPLQLQNTSSSSSSSSLLLSSSSSSSLSLDSRREEYRLQQSKLQKKLIVEKIKRIVQNEVPGSYSLKALFGDELWFEEKIRRKQRFESNLIDDNSLEKLLIQEWNSKSSNIPETHGFSKKNSGSSSFRKSTPPSNDSDNDNSSNNINNKNNNHHYHHHGSDVDVDVIEVYNEFGELVGTYSAAEYNNIRSQ